MCGAFVWCVLLAVSYELCGVLHPKKKVFLFLFPQVRGGGLPCQWHC
jgi:hypothetical protein